MRILIASTYVPFIKGGGTQIVEFLRDELVARGFETDTVCIPFHSYWRDIPRQTLALRLLDLGESSGNRIDRVITIRTPSYAVQHPNKVAWFIHHHRDAYDLWDTEMCGMPDTPVGRHYRDLMHKSDNVYLRECRKVYTNSKVVADRLRQFNRLEPDGVLYPPLPREHPFREGPFGDYIFYASRLTPIKRQHLAIDALKHTPPDVRLVLAGAPDVPGYLDTLREQAREAGVEERVEFTGWIGEKRKAELLAGSCGALYLAYQEDSYGYASLEAFHAAKPVITLTDSGGPLEVIEDRLNGLVVPPEPTELADAMTALWMDRERGKRLGEEARNSLERFHIDWDHVVETLTQ
jgi:glycosyltransferase involved in cell wall biosynthesis